MSEHIPIGNIKWAMDPKGSSTRLEHFSDERKAVQNAVHVERRENHGRRSHNDAVPSSEAMTSSHAASPQYPSGPTMFLLTHSMRGNVPNRIIGLRTSS